MCCWLRLVPSLFTGNEGVPRLALVSLRTRSVSLIIEIMAVRAAATAARAPCWLFARRVTGRALSSVGGADRELRVDRLQEDFKGVAVFAMNRPSAKNAFSKVFMNQFHEALASVKHDRDVRTVILKSDVPGVFSAGADLKERPKMTEEEVAKYVAQARQGFVELSELPMPVIAALDGVAVGGGLELALATDIRVAAENARMGLVETRLAIIPGAGGTQRLPRLVGLGKAKELIFTAKVVMGEEAFEIGLVEHVVPQNDDSSAAYLKALEIAKEILDKGPVAVAMAKLAINSGMQADLSTAMKVEQACYAQVIPTEDRMEALMAFKEKRKPVFKGK